MKSVNDIRTTREVKTITCSDKKPTKGLVFQVWWKLGPLLKPLHFGEWVAEDVKMCATTYSQTSVHKIKKLHVHHFTPTAHHSLGMMNLEQLFWKSAICLLCWGKACMWGRTWRHTGGRGRQGFTVQWAASLQSPATEGDRHTHARARWRLHYIFITVITPNFVCVIWLENRQ